ncbi:MAG: putative RNA methyltransferase, partial [Actinomycetes bacterium]
MGLAEVEGLLACPVCTQPLTLVEGPARLVCGRAHSFDVARAGYVNLAGQAPPANADTPAMVAARDRFLARGHYGAVADAVAAQADLPGTTGSTLLDCGAGTGYHLARLLEAAPSARGVAVDVSPAAARRAAKAHLRIGAVVADAWGRLPMVDGGVDVALSVFAPRRADELHRVLSASGRLVTVTPEPDHLRELRAVLPLLDVPEDKQERLAATLQRHFRLDHATTVRAAALWDAATAGDVVAMGPN